MAETAMTQGIEAGTETQPVDTARVSVRALATEWWLWVGVSAVALAAAVFLLHQLMAWPPHEDETLALFVGRDDFPGVIEHVTQERGGAPLHFVLAWGVAHLGFGLGGLRFVSAFFAVASLPLVAALALRLGSTRAVALLATALVAPSWLFLFHGVYGRMYSLFLCCSLVCSLALLAALERGGRGRWALWVVAALVTVAAHPYAVLLLAGQGAYVLVARRDRLKEAAVAGAVVLVVGIPFWLTDLVLVDRFEVGVGGGGEKLGGPGAVARYFWRSLGDATAGWWPVTLAVLAAAVLGVVSMRGRARAFVLSSVGVTTAAFVLARLGGSAAPESRHLIFLAPLLAIAVASGIVRLARRLPTVAVLATALLLVLEVAWAWERTPALFEWEPDARQAARAKAETGLAATTRKDDVLFGYEPLYLGAWERDRSGFSMTVVPRADANLALDTLRKAPSLGRGIWVFDASDTNNFTRSLEIPLRFPTRKHRFEARVFGPFLVIRSREPTGTPKRFLEQARAAELVGKSLYIGDADINLVTVDRAIARLARD
jgi:hypothetical protein